MSKKAMCFGLLACALAAVGCGPSVPSIAKMRSGEAGLAYPNRIAKDVFAGTWEATWDLTDLVSPDGSNPGIVTWRITFNHSPTKYYHGTAKIENNKGGSFRDAFSSLESINWSLNCAVNPKVGCMGAIDFSPNGDTNPVKLFNLNTELMHFVLKTATKFVQENGSSVGGLCSSSGLSQEEVVWKKVN